MRRYWSTLLFQNLINAEKRWFWYQKSLWIGRSVLGVGRGEGRAMLLECARRLLVFWATFKYLHPITNHNVRVVSLLFGWKEEFVPKEKSSKEKSPPNSRPLNGFYCDYITKRGSKKRRHRSVNALITSCWICGSVWWFDSNIKHKNLEQMNRHQLGQPSSVWGSKKVPKSLFILLFFDRPEFAWSNRLCVLTNPRDVP